MEGTSSPSVASPQHFSSKAYCEVKDAMERSMLEALENKDRRLKIKAIADAGVDKLKEPMGCSTCKTITVDWSRLTTTVIWLSINCACTLSCCKV